MECGGLLKLTNRLFAVYEMVDKCNRIADVGTDHAYIPIYCVENKKCRCAIASDINEGPILIAQNNIEKHGLEKQIETRISNGLENYKNGEADAIIIAGMGGLLIADIIKNAKSKISNDTVLVLQPMTAVYELRKFLCENGFEITDEALAQEENKIYNIIKCRKGSCFLSEPKLYTGEKFLINKGGLFIKYMDKKIYTAQKIINGLEKSDNTKELLSHYEKELSYYKTARERANNAD